MPAGSVGASARRANNAMSGLQMGYSESAPQKHSRIARLERFALLLVFSPQEFALIVHRTRQIPSSHDTLRVPRIQNHFTQCQNKNGHLSVTVSVLAERMQSNPNLNLSFQFHSG